MLQLKEDYNLCHAGMSFILMHQARGVNSVWSCMLGIPVNFECLQCVHVYNNSLCSSDVPTSMSGLPEGAHSYLSGLGSSQDVTAKRVPFHCKYAAALMC